MTDQSDDESTHRERLGTIFVEVTGTDELLDEQERNVSASREVPVEADGRTRTLSEYVSAMVRDDGLAEAFDEPDTAPSPD